MSSDINQAVSTRLMAEQAKEMPPPKAVLALETSHDLVSAIASKLTSLEKRLEHVSLPNNMTDIKKASPVPSEPSSNFVNGLYSLNKNLQELSDRVSVILELLEI